LSGSLASNATICGGRPHSPLSGGDAAVDATVVPFASRSRGHAYGAPTFSERASASNSGAGELTPGRNEGAWRSIVRLAAGGQPAGSAPSTRSCSVASSSHSPAQTVPFHVLPFAGGAKESSVRTASSSSVTGAGAPPCSRPPRSVAGEK
jgi:hypothetical protein